MVAFILNDRLVHTDLPKGSTLLDFVRYHQGLTGTKIGCREGDCGACTVLEGKLEAAGETPIDKMSVKPENKKPDQLKGDFLGSVTDRIRYRSIVSCLTPLGNAHGKHIVTIEGLNMDALSPIQQAFVDHNGTQCGFCTPGFVLSLTGHAMSEVLSDTQSAIASMDGNICRCTGYKSIERAAVSISRLLQDKDPANPVGWLVEHGFLPPYFLDIPERLIALKETHTSGVSPVEDNNQHLADERQNIRQAVEVSMPVQIIGGGTDLMVQRPEELAMQEPIMVFDDHALKGIRQENKHIVIGAATTASDIMSSDVMASIIPGIKPLFKLVASDPIRNMGTLGGNLVNASPIGDLSIIFLALDAGLEIEAGEPGKRRTVALKDFFLGYKQVDLQKGEVVVNLWFDHPEQAFLFNFEKVSKRTYLDIASVNSAIYLETEETLIKTCRISCGGVAAVPLFLRETSAFLSGKDITAETLKQANDVLQQEISPISDVRGSEAYKRLLARQLLYAHFLKLFTDKIEVIELRS